MLVLLRRSTRRHTPADEDLRHRRRQNLEFRKDVSFERATVRNSALQLSKECQPTYPTHIPLTSVRSSAGRIAQSQVTLIVKISVNMLAFLTNYLPTSLDLRVNTVTYSTSIKITAGSSSESKVNLQCARHEGEWWGGGGGDGDGGVGGGGGFFRK